MTPIEVPKDGLEGLKQNWRSDTLSGFLVFLLALPLSLGIAKASGYPAAMGVLTAMVGGLVVSIFMGGRLTIKGPAAGLITVCAGAVNDLGNLNIEGASGVQLACGAVVVMSLIQIGFGFLKLGSYSDFFPHAAVHGMLAAIGVLIFAKQFPILLGVDAALTKGLSPVQLYSHIPGFIMHATPTIALIGILSLTIIFGLPAIGGIFKKIPAPMIVLVVMVPLSMILNIKSDHPAAMVSIGNFWQDVKFNASFAAIGNPVFWKYVLMFLFVNSLESLLTVKAIDGLDPWKRQSDYNKDLRALAIGNGIAGALGGLPMISEVARSSANVNNGAHTRWANFFHGLFLLISMVLLISVIEMIPSAALAAMLIAVAYRLASPKEFISTYKVGKEQLLIFLITIFVTVAEDLLMGVAAGIVTKFIIHLINGAPISSLFKARYNIEENSSGYLVQVKGAAVFSNFLGYKKMWTRLAPGKQITFDFTQTRLIDHTFMEQLHHFEDDYHLTNGHVTLAGMENFRKLSEHPLAARKHGPEDIVTEKLSTRSTALHVYAQRMGYSFNPTKVRNAIKFKDFPLKRGSRILYEENVMTKSIGGGKLTFSDCTLTELDYPGKADTHMTVAYIVDTNLVIPDFALEPDSMWTRLSKLIKASDLDFHQYPVFSNKYHLRGTRESAVRAFFNETVIRFLEERNEVHMEAHANKLLIYPKRDLMEDIEMENTVTFIEAFLRAVKQHATQTI